MLYWGWCSGSVPPLRLTGGKVVVTKHQPGRATVSYLRWNASNNDAYDSRPRPCCSARSLRLHHRRLRVSNNLWGHGRSKRSLNRLGDFTCCSPTPSTMPTACLSSPESWDGQAKKQTPSASKPTLLTMRRDLRCTLIASCESFFGESALSLTSC